MNVIQYSYFKNDGPRSLADNERQGTTTDQFGKFPVKPHTVMHIVLKTETKAKKKNSKSETIAHTFIIKVRCYTEILPQTYYRKLMMHVINANFKNSR